MNQTIKTIAGGVGILALGVSIGTLTPISQAADTYTKVDTNNVKISKTQTIHSEQTLSVDQLLNQVHLDVIQLANVQAKLTADRDARDKALAKGVVASKNNKLPLNE